MKTGANQKGRQAGFTIVELMIAMTILSFIALGVYEITTSTFQRRESIEQESDFYNSLRVGLDVMGRDITQLYTPQTSALPSSVGQAASQNPNQPSGSTPSQNANVQQMPLGVATDFWDEPINKDGVRPSRFNGEETKLSFVSSSHMRIYRDSMESDFAQITYSLEERRIPDALTKGKVLIKRENTDIYAEDEKSAATEVRYMLIDNVKSVTFEYLDGEKDSWSKRWDTSGVDHKGIYPAVVKVTVEIYMPNSENTFVVVQQFRAELPI